MGSALSSGTSIPDRLDEETAQSLAGDKWDKEAFDAAAGDDGMIAKAQFLEKATPPYQFQWDQIPSSGKPTGPIWKDHYPDDCAILREAFASKAGTAKLPRGFSVVLPEKEQTGGEKSGGGVTYEAIPAEELGSQTHDRKGWIRRVRAWREDGTPAVEGDDEEATQRKSLQFQWDEFVIEREECPFEWSNYDEDTNRTLNDAFAAAPSSTIELDMRKHGKYTVVLPAEACASADGLPAERPALEMLTTGGVPVFGNQYSHKSTQIRHVRAIPK
jgi:hypothetical protein